MNRAEDRQRLRALVVALGISSSDASTYLRLDRSLRHSGYRPVRWWPDGVTVAERPLPEPVHRRGDNARERVQHRADPLAITVESMERTHGPYRTWSRDVHREHTAILAARAGLTLP